MALTSAQQVRLRIQDAPTIYRETYNADGLASAFSLPHRNITSASAFISAYHGWSATGATFNPSGVVTFSGVMSANSAFMVNYVASVFSDDEIDHMISAGGSVLGASIEAVATLRFDGIKRAMWRGADGSEYDDTKAQDALAKMYADFLKQQENEAVIGGGLASWSNTQGGW